MVYIRHNYGGTREPISLTIGIIGIVTGMFYIINKINFLNMSFAIPDSLFINFFAYYVLIAGVILTFKAMIRRHY